jgi:hypothetical protein
MEQVRILRRGKGRPRRRPGRAMGDKAYSSAANRSYLRRRGIQAVIPVKEDQNNHRRARGRRGGRPPAFDPGQYRQRNTVEMVFPQLAKGAVRPVGRGREDVADLDLVIGDDHAVDEQLGELPPLLEGRGSQAGPGGLAEGPDAVGNGLQFQLLPGGGI